jgi:hypothetical protein
VERGVGRPDVRRVAVAELVEAAQQLLTALRVALREPLRRVLDSQRLERQPRLIDVVEIVDRELGDPGARCGTFSTRPAASRRRSASRTGIGLISSTSARSSIGSRSPGLSSPATIASWSATKAFSASVR